MANLSELDRKIAAVRAAVARLPNEVAAVAVDFSKERFRHQSWLDTTPEKWKPRKRQRKGKRGQTLLVDTGRLRRSIRKISADMNKVVIGTDVPYAQIHNEGGKITATAKVRGYAVKAHKVKAHARKRDGRTERVKAHVVKAHRVKTHTRKMNTTIPRRQFLGESVALERRVMRLITLNIEKALRL